MILSTKKLKKIFLFLSAIILIVAVFFSVINIKKVNAEDLDIKQIDMYLIAGSSDAVGSSSINNYIGVKKEFNNVFYASDIDNPIGKNRSTDNLTNYSKSVTLGLGQDSNTIGLEYGLASVLNDVYNNDTKAMIFKSAATNTSVNNTSDDKNKSNKYGNWNYDSKIYSEDIDSLDEPQGRQLKLFIRNFEIVYNQLVSDGYKPIIKTLFWLPDTYYDSIKANNDFLIQTEKTINRLVYYTSLITRQSTSTINIGVTEIPIDYRSFKDEDTYNRTFNSFLSTVVQNNQKAFLVSSNNLRIFDENKNIIGTGIYFLNCYDMIELGIRAAEQALQLQSKSYVAVRTGQKADVNYKIDDSQLNFTVTPIINYYIKTVYVNGINVTSEGNNNEWSVILDIANNKNNTITVNLLPIEKSGLPLLQIIFISIGALFFAGIVFLIIRVYLNRRRGKVFNTKQIDKEIKEYKEKQSKKENIVNIESDVITSKKKDKSNKIKKQKENKQNDSEI